MPLKSHITPPATASLTRGSPCSLSQDQVKLSIEGLCYHYGNSEVLCNITTEARAGEIIGIIGPNGGGKSTFLKLIAGVLKPTRGFVTFIQPSQSARVDKLKAIDRRGSFADTLSNLLPKLAWKDFPLRKRFLGARSDSAPIISYVPQRWKIDHQFPLNALEVTASGMIRSNLWGVDYDTKVLEVAEELLDAVAISPSAPIGTLSGGQLQRLLLARALINRPALLLLDEATSQIDPVSQQIIHEQISKHRKSSIICLVSHQLDEVAQLCNRVWCIQGTLEELDPSSLCRHHAHGLYHQPQAMQHPRAAEIPIAKR